MFYLAFCQISFVFQVVFDLPMKKNKFHCTLLGYLHFIGIVGVCQGSQSGGYRPHCIDERYLVVDYYTVVKKSRLMLRKINCT